ncbi:hypothetical protein ACVWY0_002920 [Arthrobacter sp. UYNi723]
MWLFLSGPIWPAGGWPVRGARAGCARGADPPRHRYGPDHDARASAPGVMRGLFGHTWRCWAWIWAARRGSWACPFRSSTSGAVGGTMCAPPRHRRPFLKWPASGGASTRKREFPDRLQGSSHEAPDPGQSGGSGPADALPECRQSLSSPPLVLMVPLTPAGKNPPEVTSSGVRYAMFSTWAAVRLKASPLASVGTRLATAAVPMP